MKLFISYSRKDQMLLEELASQIIGTYPKATLWYDKEIHGGDDWWQRILREIRQCTIFLYLVSQASLESRYCQDELREALRQDKAILPVLIGKLSPQYPGNIANDLASELTKIQYVDVTDNLNNTQIMPRLWAAINQLQRDSHRTQRIQLSRTERWILSNQFAILAELKSDDAETYKTMQEIVESGYEWEYENITEHIYDDRFTMHRDECLEVVNILDMFSVLSSAYQELEDKSGIERGTIKFVGFDGNSETKYTLYALFLVERQGKFNWLSSDNGFNSHIRMLDHYRMMLWEWENSGEKYNLTREDIIRITSVNGS